MITLRWDSYPQPNEGDILTLELQRPGQDVPLLFISGRIGSRPDFPLGAAEALVAAAWRGIQESQRRATRGQPRRPLSLSLELYGEHQRGKTIGQLCAEYDLRDESAVKRRIGDAKRVLRQIESLRSHQS